ncbi:MAG TPA: hypothetical protein PLW10_13465 [Myxococcota bacterium]|nr:hypothetical protein [Myxococcales bacterium]HPG26639.1 hypothetical protein [Myxococcota bacterium]
MASDERDDEAIARELLGLLGDEDVDAPASLPDRAIRKVQAELTGRDLIDLTTFVFLVRFCAPILDLFAAFFGHDPKAAGRQNPRDRSHDDE